MSFENQHGMKGAPGLAFPCVTHSIETGVMQQDKDSEGGFVLWIKTGEAGEAGKVYVDKPENGAFLGIAQRTLYNDSYKAGMTVNVLKKGRLYVRVLGEVKAGDSAYVTKPTTPSPLPPQARFKSLAECSRLTPQMANSQNWKSFKEQKNNGLSRQ